MGIQSTDGSEHGGGFVGDSEDLTDPMGGSVDGGSDGSGPLSRDTWLDEDRTPEIVMAKLFEPADLVEGAVSTALAQVGQHEDAPNSGLMVDQYLNSVGLPPGNSWCASFVHWCFLMASNAIGMLNPCPKTGGVLRLWELAPDEVKVASPVRGAVVIMDHGHGHGHTGIVESVNGGGLIETVEGNTNKAGSREGDSVARHIWRPEDGARGKLVGYLDFSRVPLVSKKSAAV